MNSKLKPLFSVLIGAFLGIFVMYSVSNYKIEKVGKSAEVGKSEKNVDLKTDENFEILDENNIDQLTNEKSVIDFVKKNHKLPDFYITKSEARKLGWNPSEGNLCTVLPNHAIGGDYFSNREKQLPKGGQYFEADVNYSCGNRNSDRIIFTKNGDVWLTKNHYRTFEKQ